MGKNERKSVSKIVISTSAALLILFAVAGSEIFAIFGISISSFMVAGGVLALYRIHRIAYSWHMGLWKW